MKVSVGGRVTGKSASIGTELKRIKALESSSSCGHYLKSQTSNTEGLENELDAEDQKILLDRV